MRITQPLETTSPYSGHLYLAKLTGERKNTKMRKIFEYIRDNGPVSKYEIVTKVLGCTGSRTDLRGHYSTNLLTMRRSGLLNLDWESRTYQLTTKSAKLVFDAKTYPEWHI